MTASGGIYAIVNTRNGKQYIGSAVNFQRRWKNHRSLLRLGRHHSVHLQRAWLKDGEDAFAFTILEIVTNLDTIIAREQVFIDRLRPAYNIAREAGSTCGLIPTDAHRAKISAAFKGKKRPEISVALKGHRGWNRGRIVSDETRAKLSAAGKGRKQSEQHRVKIGQAHTGKQKPYMAARNQSEEMRRKVSAALKGKPRPWVADRNRRTAAMRRAQRLTPNAKSGMVTPSLWE